MYESGLPRMHQKHCKITPRHVWVDCAPSLAVLFGAENQSVVRGLSATQKLCPNEPRGDSDRPSGPKARGRVVQKVSEWDRSAPKPVQKSVRKSAAKKKENDMKNK